MRYKQDICSDLQSHRTKRGGDGRNDRTDLDRTLWREPMPRARDRHLFRWVTRTVGFTAMKRVESIEGADTIRFFQGPAIIAANHSQWLEALYLPALLAIWRKGLPVGFLADWNFCLIPPIWFLYHLDEAIIIDRKPAKPRILNALKPIFTRRAPALEEAKQRLESGRWVGVFPEGTAYRNPFEMLRGSIGAAKLSLVSQVPIIPVGIQYPFAQEECRHVQEGDSMRVVVGEPMNPPRSCHGFDRSQLPDWHAAVMTAISLLANQTWNPNRRIKHAKL